MMFSMWIASFILPVACVGQGLETQTICNKALVSILMIVISFIGTPCFAVIRKLP